MACNKKFAPTTFNLVDPSYELIDPIPDVHTQFVLFNDQFFYGSLGTCTVEWSNKLTSCAGICEFQPQSGFCTIRLSEPLLKLRPRKDLLQTLLHEMIHAYLCLTKCLRDRYAHGPEFQFHMHRINRMAGTSITIYHSFFAEVAFYKGQQKKQKQVSSVKKRAILQYPSVPGKYAPFSGVGHVLGSKLTTSAFEKVPIKKRKKTEVVILTL